MRKITIDQIVNAEADMLGHAEEAMEALTALVQSCGRYSPEEDLEEAMALILQMSHTANMVVIHAQGEIRKKQLR